MKLMKYTLYKQYDFMLYIFSTDSATGGKFLPSDAFIGFQKDTPAAVVFQATKQLKENPASIIEHWPDELREWSFGPTSGDWITVEEEGSVSWCITVSKVELHQEIHCDRQIRVH